ncbi:MAG: hypothetical protein JRM97_08345 [Nitrososphaerota archaeon]|nr:hypothetical protein [Nitrososphaerota archaeon]MDG6937471.1 hypothetical protein [Nitrososphaerota archaeon]MDG6961995.1 hypothetical protein [Nitrososphaerota archaeon]MDG6962914.1 hypothetical protein [Nitrososphaerota archaeon]MDG6969685.1 hypothetical protein [Nitrososphaerota archaeon]
METRTKRRWQKAALAAALVAVVAVVGALEAFPFQTYAFQAPEAVGFSVLTNSTTLAPGQTLGLAMKDTNYLPFPNSPRSRLGMNLSSGVCGLLFPFGVAAYAGDYSLGNVSSATQVQVFDVFGYFLCPLISIGPFALSPFRSVTKTAHIDGYWTAGQTQAPGGGFSEGVFHPFAPGEYTLVVGDGWGHTAVVHFRVTAGT